MTDAPSWVDLAPTVEPIRAWLATQTGKTVSFARAPGRGVPPFTVLQIVNDARPLLTMDGGIPVDVIWQLDHLGETPTQALALADKGARAMMLDDPPVIAGAIVVAREPLGGTPVEMIAENRWQRQQRFRWTLVAATVPAP